MKQNHKGFGIIEVILVIVVVSLVGGTSWFIYSKHYKTPPTSTTEVSPTAFTKGLLGVLGTDNQSSLQKLLTPAFASFRDNNLAKGPCNGSMSPALTCTSVLDNRAIDTFANMTPDITNYTFKSGQMGKTVTYRDTTDYIDPTYFTFYLIPSGNSWLLNDYSDLGVTPGSTFSVIAGTMESQ